MHPALFVICNLKGTKITPSNNMATASSSRRRIDDNVEEEVADDYALPADYKPYVPVAKRRAQLKSTLTSKQQQAKRPKVSVDELHRELATQQEEDNEEEKAREKLRRERTLLQAAQEVKEQRALAGEPYLCERRASSRRSDHADESEIRIKAKPTWWLNKKHSSSLSSREVKRNWLAPKRLQREKSGQRA